MKKNIVLKNKSRIGSSLIALGLAFIFLLVSCSTQEEVNKKIEDKNSGSTPKTTVLTPTKKEPVVLTPKDNTDDNADAALAKKENVGNALGSNRGGAFGQNISGGDAGLSSAARDGAYEKIITLTEGKNDYSSKYYRGIARMSMMLQRNKYSPSERVEFRDEALDLLREVGYQANDESLQARGLLWYGVTLDLAFTDLKNKKKAIGAFYRIEKSKLNDSQYYNDALFYAAYTYTKMGWYGVARNYFRKAGRATRNDTQVYDYVDNKFYSLDEALEVGLDRLDSYVEGYNENYSRVE